MLTLLSLSGWPMAGRVASGVEVHCLLKARLSAAATTAAGAGRGGRGGDEARLGDGEGDGEAVAGLEPGLGDGPAWCGIAWGSSCQARKAPDLTLSQTRGVLPGSACAGAGLSGCREAAEDSCASVGPV